MSQVSVERVGPVARVAMYNPPEGYMNSATIRELSAAMDSLEADPLIRAIIFTGAMPGLFMLHYDVSEIIVTAKALKGSRAGIPDARDMPFHGLFTRIEACAKPTIAAINGHCIGGGLEFALCCDLRLAGAGDYRIGMPEIRVGIFPGGGGTQRLARTIGTAAALDCILRARLFSPREAAARGLVHDCVVGDVLGEATRTAEVLASHPPKAVASVKHLVRGAATWSLDEGLEREWQAYAGLLTADSSAVDRLETFADKGMPMDRSST
ncbi:MAG: enoyl-CoA hydratase/isomerase family protein [Alphaproteobacteria bacterium]